MHRVRVLILGATGMLGHRLWLSLKEHFDTWGTVRVHCGTLNRYGFDTERMLGDVDVLNFGTVVRAFEKVQPNCVVNCIGIIKQLPAAHDPVASLTVNSLFPHQLASLCRATNARLIHISTDCVFSGRKGMYTEEDISDAEDLYGRTKFLGEVAGANCLTLRTSIIGREIGTTNGLVEWFRANRGQRVQGYTRAIYSGLTTRVLARLIAQVIDDYPRLSGLYHVSAEPISKYDLLSLLNDAYRVGVTIDQSSDIVLDRSLDCCRFRRITGFAAPTWLDMIQDMASDPTPYDQWRAS